MKNKKEPANIDRSVLWVRDCFEVKNNSFKLLRKHYLDEEQGRTT